MMIMHTDYFYGNKVSQYGIDNGYVDYRTLAKSFDAVLNNDIMSRTYDIGYWEQVSGYVDNSEEIEEIQERIEELEEAGEDVSELQERIEELEEEQENPGEVFQYYIVSNNGAAILEEAGEIVYYSDTLDMYLWGVTHYGTSWDYVLTNIKIVKE